MGPEPSRRRDIVCFPVGIGRIAPYTAGIQQAICLWRHLGVLPGRLSLSCCSLVVCFPVGIYVLPGRIGIQRPLCALLTMQVMVCFPVGIASYDPRGYVCFPV